MMQMNWHLKLIVLNYACVETNKIKYLFMK